MASYLDQIPKQLAARRKAFRAAQSNPALLPSCWAIVRSIANNMYEYCRNSLIGGCTFPDRPIYFSENDCAFLNFGATPQLLRTNTAWNAIEEKGIDPATVAEAERDALPPELVQLVRKQLAGLVATYATNHAITRVYNLEPWLQDMYRDRLDVDFAEDLQRQIDTLNAYMDSVPKSIAATGLESKLSKGVLDAFNLFKTITGSSHQLDREKMSFVDRRSYVNTAQKIEFIMAKADESLHSGVVGKSVVREQFELWKAANYEMMGLTRQLRALWAGTSLDDRIQELANLLGAIQKALNRCSEDTIALQSTPQLPVFIGEEQSLTPLTRQEITDAFRAICLYDMVASGQPILQVRELRKFGPLSVVLAPGRGDPRYCAEIRKIVGVDDESKSSKPNETQLISKERETDADRRLRYPMNCLVTPLGTSRETFPVAIADAWLEYNQAAFPVQFKEFIDGAKAAAPGAFVISTDKPARDSQPSLYRQRLARLVAAFVLWAHSGVEAADADLPGFAAFKNLALSRLKSDAFLLPMRYRPFVELFTEAGPKRRMEMWKRCLGPRFVLDRQMVAVSVLMKDWNSLESSLKFLPPEITRDNVNLSSGFAKTRDQSDQFAEHKAESFFRKFLGDYQDLKSALVTVESQVSIEVETLRTQSESLGKVFQYDTAAETMMRRQASQIQEKRMAVNDHIDHYLIGLMYAVSGNLEAAESSLIMGLGPAEAADAPAPVPEEIGEEWFRDNLKPKDGQFERRSVAGEDSEVAICHDLLYYNLGIVYLKLQKYTEARMCFKALLTDAPEDQSFLYRQWAVKHMETAKEAMDAAAAAAAAAEKK